jgi:hypothetical protein
MSRRVTCGESIASPAATSRIAWTMSAGGVSSGLDGPSKWLDMGQTTVPLSEFDMSGTAWARLATSALLWVGVPLAIGLARILRREVS